MSVGRDGSVSTATRYGLKAAGIESGGARVSTPVQTGPRALPILYEMGSFPWVQTPGCGVSHPTPSSEEVKETVWLHFCSHSGLHGLF